MKQSILASLLAALLLPSIAHADPKSKKEPRVETTSAATSRMHEFQADDISLVIRSLARQAGMNVVIDNRITGTVNMRLDNKTPREAIEIIAQSRELLIEERKGVFYIRHKNPPPELAEGAKSLEEAFTQSLAPTLTKFYDSILDYQARPETAQKLAKAKKALYDALIAEGFTKDEAFRIILTHQELPLPDSGK